MSPIPKLPAKVAKRVNDAKSSDLEALPANMYHGELVSVTVKDGTKAPYWSWEFDLQDDGYVNRKLWVNTSTLETADWKMKEVFNAFGYDADTDTDELIGQTIKLSVSQRVIEQGARKGELGNNVDKCLPLGEGGADEEDGEDTF